MTEVRSFGRVKVILGPRNGKYPYGNSIVVEDDTTALIDPSLWVFESNGKVTERKIDLLFNSHYHEDHGVGNCLFPHLPLHIHPLDAPAMRSIDTILDYYGMSDVANELWKPIMVEKFRYQSREHFVDLHDGQVFDFGHTRMRVMHTPGHTGGHCCFFFENEDLLFLADWDLTRFGPVYGDLTSDLTATIASLEKIRALRAKVLVSFHHVGICEEGQDALVTRYLGTVYERERLLLDFLAEPRTLAEIIRKRIVYRKDYPEVAWVDAVERNSMSLHLRKLIREGRIARDEERYWRCE
jgi:hydroxyacylglutathione hydrolase